MESEDDCVAAAKKAMFSCKFDALPVTEVMGFFSFMIIFIIRNLILPQAVPVAHSFLTRGVDSGLLSICSCLIQALNVPIVSVPELEEFFKTDQVSYLKYTTRLD